MARKEHVSGQFIEEASRLFSDALTHTLDDASKLVNVYAIVSKLRLFASPLVLSTAEQVMDRIIELYESPEKNLHEVLKVGRMVELDILRRFSEACRKDLAV
jgi:hypothetical protein